MANYSDIVAVLRVVGEHETAQAAKGACKPCDVDGLAEATGLEPQEVADRLSAALKRGRMITAREKRGATEPYFDQVRLSANGRAAVESAKD